MNNYSIDFYTLETLPNENNNFLIDCVQQNIGDIIIKNNNGVGSLVIFNNQPNT